MAEPAVLAMPIELHDAELDIVFGAGPAIKVFGGRLVLGGGSGPTAFSGTVTISTPTGTTTDTVSFAEGRSGSYTLVIDGVPSLVGSGNARVIDGVPYLNGEKA